MITAFIRVWLFGWTRVEAVILNMLDGGFHLAIRHAVWQARIDAIQSAYRNGYWSIYQSEHPLLPVFRVNEAGGLGGILGLHPFAVPFQALAGAHLT